MNKRIKSILALIVLIAALAGCVQKEVISNPDKDPTEDGTGDKDDDNKGDEDDDNKGDKEDDNKDDDSGEGEEGIHLTFTALPAFISQPSSNPFTTSTDLESIRWSEDSKISIFDGSAKNCLFELTGKASGISGTFEGEVTAEAESYSALYPYDSSVTLEDGKFLGVVLPGNQAAIAGSFDPASALMTCRNFMNLMFGSVVGYIKLVCDFDCDEVTISSHENSVALAGKFDIASNELGYPNIADIHEIKNSVTLSGQIEKGKTYYIAVIPCTMAGGYTLTFKSAGKELFSSSSDDEITVSSGVMTDLGTFKKPTPYITFSADGPQTFKMTKGSAMTEDFIMPEYSVNGGEWSTIESGSEISFGGDLGKLRLRGNNPNGTSETVRGYGVTLKSCTISFSSQDVKVRCSGDIRTLVDWEHYDTADTKEAVFARLFVDCTALETAPDLPATDINQCCYMEMFKGCTSLKKAPDLPATTLAYQCYHSLFSGCTSLETAPALPATALTEACYQAMFSGCTSLKTAPELPATTLAEICYSAMFSGCTSLTKAPKLPAETVPQQGYYCMFRGCSKLETAPELPAKELGFVAYGNMFQGCTSLKKAPVLSATKLGEQCYKSMFMECTITEAPELPATTLAVGCYSYMFKLCASLTKAPVLPANTLVESCYRSMFQGCSSLNYVKAMFTSGMDATNCLRDWLDGTAEGGGTLELYNNCPNSESLWLYVTEAGWEINKVAKTDEN